jgi:hypothetical protein
MFEIFPAAKSGSWISSQCCGTYVPSTARFRRYNLQDLPGLHFDLVEFNKHFSRRTVILEIRLILNEN